MNSARTSSHQARLLRLIAFVSLSAGVGNSQAQQALSADEFYRQGDHMSNKVSGFFRNIFGSGAPSGRTYVNPQSPAPAANYPQQSYPQQGMSNDVSSVQAPSTRSYESTPTHQASPKVSSTSRVQKSLPKKSSSSELASNTAPRKEIPVSKSPVVTPKQSDPSEKGGFYTSAKKRNDDSASSSSSNTPKSQPSVVSAPPEKSAPSSGANRVSIPDVTAPTPSEAPKPTPPIVKTTPPVEPKVEPKKTETSPPPTSVNAAGAPSNQSFPTGSFGSRPGRVVSPYPPHRELDVKGLPSGSLALDPTSQKVFKVP